MPIWQDTPEYRDRLAEIAARTYYTVGLDLGETNDYTALSVLKIDWENNENDPNARLHVNEPRMAVVYLERYRHVLYPDVAEKVLQRLLRPPLWGQSDLIVDSTGVGRGVSDIFTKLGVPFKGVTITGGENENRGEDGYYRVPKKILVAASLIPFQQDRLKIAGRLPLAPILRQEMQGFRWKQNAKTGHETFQHREGEHDDIVLSVSLAAWGAVRFGGSDVTSDLAGAADPYKMGDELSAIPTLDEWW